MDYLITRLTDRPELKAQAAAWFHAKWGVPEQAYLDSMDDALRRAAPVPQWYLAMEGPRIIGGMGVIENDFHDRDSDFFHKRPHSWYRCTYIRDGDSFPLPWAMQKNSQPQRS